MSPFFASQMRHDLVYQIARAFWIRHGSPEAFRPEKTDTINVLWFKVCGTLATAFPAP